MEDRRGEMAVDGATAAVALAGKGNRVTRGRFFSYLYTLCFAMFWYLYNLHSLLRGVYRAAREQNNRISRLIFMRKLVSDRLWLIFSPFMIVIRTHRSFQNQQSYF